MSPLVLAFGSQASAVPPMSTATCPTCEPVVSSCIEIVVAAGQRHLSGGWLHAVPATAALPREGSPREGPGT